MAVAKESFDEDPGWDGIEGVLAPNKLPVKLRREFLAEKRETGKFENKWDNDAKKQSSSSSSSSKKLPAKKPSRTKRAQSTNIGDFFSSRRHCMVILLCGFLSMFVINVSIED